jgi:hypothetical protein
MFPTVGRRQVGYVQVGSESDDMWCGCPEGAIQVVGIHSRMEPAMGSGAIWGDAWWGVDLQVLLKHIAR